MDELYLGKTNSAQSGAENISSWMDQDNAKDLKDINGFFLEMPEMLILNPLANGDVRSLGGGAALCAPLERTGPAKDRNAVVDPSCQKR